MYNPEANEKLKQARQLLKQNRLTEAEEIALEVYRKYPDHDYTHFVLGEIYYRRRDYPKVIFHHEKAVQTLNYAPAFYQLGAAYYMLSEWDKGIEACTKAIESQPEGYTEAHRFRGKCYLIRGEYLEAIKDLAYVVAVNPAQYNARRDLLKAFDQAFLEGRRSLQEGNIAAGIATFERLQALVSSQFDYHCHYNLGYGYLRNDQWEKASAEFGAVVSDEKASRLYMANAHYYLALAILRVDDPIQLVETQADTVLLKQAIKELETALELDEAPRVRFGLGTLYFHTGNHSDAKEHLLAMPLEETQLHGYSSFLLSQMNLVEGDTSSAIHNLREVAETVQLPCSVFLEAGRAFAQHSDFDSSMWCFEEAEDLACKSGQMDELMAVARSYQSCPGSEDKAVGTYLRVIEIDDTHEEALLELLTLYKKLWRFEEALDTYSQLLRLYTEQRRYELAHALIEQELNHLDRLTLMFDRADLLETEGKLSEAFDVWFNVACERVVSDESAATLALFKAARLNPEDSGIDYVLHEIKAKRRREAEIKREEVPEEEEITLDDFDIESTALPLDKRIVIVGGSPNLENNCRAHVFRDFVATPAWFVAGHERARARLKSMEAKIANSDGVVIVHNYGSHTLINGAIEAAKRADIPYVYVESNSRGQLGIKRALAELKNEIECAKLTNIE